MVVATNVLKVNADQVFFVSLSQNNYKVILINVIKNELLLNLKVIALILMSVLFYYLLCQLLLRDM